MDSSESKPATSRGFDKSPLTACFVSWKTGAHTSRATVLQTQRGLALRLGQPSSTWFLFGPIRFSTLTWTSAHTGNGCLQLCGDTAWEVEDWLDFGHSPPTRPWPCKSHVENLQVIGSPTEQALPGLCRSHTVSLWAWRAGSLQRRTQIVG